MNQKDLQSYIQKLEDQNEFKSELISTSAHQIRTTLTANKWALKELLNGATNDEQKKLLEKLIESNDQTIRSVTELIDVNHTEETHPRYSFELVDIEKILHMVIQDFQSEAEEKNIALSFDDSVETPLIIADKQKLKTVFQALIENAIKYSHPEGSIMVHIDIEENSIVISVKDEGIGIPESEQDQIFQKFFRASNAEEKESIGSGIGLFSSAHIIHMHQGALWFNSRENIGTTFFVELPLPHDEDIVE
jgi:two-component system sensor histidine kinase VicK